MKICVNCGFECSDETLTCQACNTDAFVTTSPEALGHVISPEEHRFWERMTFRQFAVFLIRLQALWLLFFVFVEATYLIPFLTAREFTPAASTIVLRGALYLALAVICLRYADRIVSWFVRDLIPKTPPNTPPEPAAASSVPGLPANPSPDGGSPSPSTDGSSA